MAAVLAWDVPQLRGSVGTLDLAAGRAPAWRARVDAVARELGRPGVWSGAAATAAHAALVELSSVASGVQSSVAEAVGSLGLAVEAAAHAQELVVSALAVAEAGPVVLGDDGTLLTVVPPPSPVMSPEQLGALDAMSAAARQSVALAAAAQEQVAAVLGAASAAELALLPLGLVGGRGPVDLTDLVRVVLPPGAPPVPPPPDGRGPAAVATWWDALDAGQQAAALARDTALLGGLDGLPAWTRDLANRALLADELATGDPGSDRHRTAAVVSGQLAAQEAAGRTVQLHTLDLERDLVALAVGDLDTAGDLAVLVPGILSTPADDLGGLTAAAVRTADAARSAAPDAGVAVLVWLGYRTPGLVGSVLTVAARRGGPALDATLDGLAAQRRGDRPRTTVVAHSYGTVVVDHAADAPGELAADAVVLLGSPGISEWSADGLEADEVYDAATPADPVSWAGWHGLDTWGPLWGSEGLPTDPGQGHTEYLDDDRPTLAAVGEVVAGTRPR